MPAAPPQFTSLAGLLTKTDVMGRLQCSLGRVNWMIRKGRRSYLKVERSVRFRPEAVENYLKQHLVEHHAIVETKKTLTAMDIKMGRF